MSQRLPSWIGEIARQDLDGKLQNLTRILVAQYKEGVEPDSLLKRLLCRVLGDIRQRKTKCFPSCGLTLNMDFVNSLDMTPRTTKGLLRYLNLIDKEMPIKDITFGQLAGIEQLGAKSVLEFLNTIERYNGFVLVVPEKPAVNDSLLGMQDGVSQELPSLANEVGRQDLDGKLQDLTRDVVAQYKEGVEPDSLLIRFFSRDKRETKCFPSCDLTLNMDFVNSLDMTPRTTKGLLRYLNLIDKEIPIKDITFHQLAGIERLGAKSVLEFLNSVERYNGFVLVGPEKPAVNDPLYEAQIHSDVDELIISLLLEPDLNQIFRGDLRFPSLNVYLPVPGWQLGSSFKLLIEEAQVNYKDWQQSDKLQLMRLLSSLQSEISHVRDMPVDVALKHLISLYYKRRDDAVLEVMFNRYGLGVDEIPTLKVCGELTGVSRARIGQIEQRIAKGIEALPGEGRVYMPFFWKAVEFIYDEIGNTVETISDHLVSAGLSKGPISTRGLFFFNGLLRGNKIELAMEKMANGDITLENLDLDVDLDKGEFFAEMRRVWARDGVANINRAYERATHKIVAEDYHYIVRIVSSSGVWKSLDSEMRWWIPMDMSTGGSNRLIKLARKALSVVPSITMREIREGYERFARYDQTSNHVEATKVFSKHCIPPLSIITEFFKNVPGFVAAEQSLSYEGCLDFREELGPAEVVLVEAIRESGQDVLSRAELLSSCLQKGFSNAQISSCISISSVIKPAGEAVYQVIGGTVDASSYFIKRVQVAEKRNRWRRVSLVNCEQGRIQIACQLNGVYVDDLVIEAPSSAKALLINKNFAMYNDEGDKCGLVGINEEGAIYGVRRSFFGVIDYFFWEDRQVNNILLLSFDLLKLQVEVSLINFEDFQNIASLKHELY